MARKKKSTIFTFSGSTHLATTRRISGTNIRVTTTARHNYELFPRRITGNEGLKKRRHYDRSSLPARRAKVYRNTSVFKHSAQAKFRQVPGRVRLQTFIEPYSHFGITGGEHTFTTWAEHRRPWRLEGDKHYYTEGYLRAKRSHANRLNPHALNTTVRLSKAARQRAAKKRRRVKGRFA